MLTSEENSVLMAIRQKKTTQEISRTIHDMIVSVVTLSLNNKSSEASEKKTSGLFSDMYTLQEIQKNVIHVNMFVD